MDKYIKNNFGGDRLIFKKEGLVSNNISDFMTPQALLNRESIFDFLLFGTMLPPLSPIEGVSTKMPGEIDNDENLYKSLDISIKNRSLKEFVDEFDIVLGEYFEKYKNEKNAVLLSGGIDSAIILSYLDRDTTCITWGGWGKESSDVIYSKITAKVFHVDNHHFVYSDFDRDIEDYKDIVKKLKIPILFSNSVPYIQMSKYAKDLGLKSWFMGQNADTVLLSYAPEVAVRKIIGIKKWFPFNPFSFLKSRKKFLFSTNNIVKLFAYFKSNGVFPGKWIKVSSEYFKRKDELVAPYISGANLSQKIILTEELLTEARRNQICQNEVPVLFDVDVFCPFYSKEFIELALSIPDWLRKKDNYDKLIFKELAKKRGVPLNVIYKEKKGLSYDHVGVINSKKHLPIWDKMERDDFLNSFIDVREIRLEKQDDFLVFDTLSSLYYYGELVVKPNGIKF